jgi:hypothetical protein
MEPHSWIQLIPPILAIQSQFNTVWRCKAYQFPIIDVQTKTFAITSLTSEKGFEHEMRYFSCVVAVFCRTELNATRWEQLRLLLRADSPHLPAPDRILPGNIV